jgi:hypothetical protein
MNPKHPSIQTEHDSAIGVSDNTIYFAKPKSLQSERKLIIQEKQLPRGLAAPLPYGLPRCPASPLSRLQSP